MNFQPLFPLVPLRESYPPHHKAAMESETRSPWPTVIPAGVAIRALPAVVLDHSGDIRGWNDLAGRLLGLDLFRRNLGRVVKLEESLHDLLLRLVHRGQLVTTATTQGDASQTLLTLFLDLEGSVVVLFIPDYLDLNKSLERIADAIVRQQPLALILRTVTDNARLLCAANRAYIKILNTESVALKFIALSSDVPTEFPEIESDPARGMTGYAFTHRVCLRSADVSKEPPNRRYAGVFKDTVSKMVVPLLYNIGSKDEQCFGVLTVDGKDAAQFGPEQEAILVTLAKHASLAIASSRALKELHTAHEQVMREFRERPELTGSRSVLHLGKNSVRDAAHEVSLVLQDIADSSFGRRWSDQLIAHADKLKNIADLLQSLLEQMAGPTQPRGASRVGVDLRAMVSKVVALAGVHEDEIRFSLDVPEEPCLVRARSGELLFLLYNLVINAVNAIRASKKGEGDILISIAGTPSRSGFIRLIIEDNGPGLPREVLEFVRHGKRVSRAEGGTGLGLLSVRQTIKDLGGSIAVDSHFGQGAKFTIDFVEFE